MTRRRLAVALLLPEPWATEIDGLRRALGDQAIADVGPHITLVHPVNVREDDLPAALALLRSAAGGEQSFTVRLGPVVTFHPVTPVAYLDVAGDVAAVHRLHDKLAAAPFGRPERFDYVPHVTVASDCPTERVAAASVAAADYVVDVELAVVHLLEDRSPGPRRWNPIADVVLGSAALVGRGGYEIELTTSTIADPELMAVFAAPPMAVPQGGAPFVVAARHDGGLVGAAHGWVRDGEAEIVEVVGDSDLERHLLARVTALGQPPGADPA